MAANAAEIDLPSTRRTRAICAFAAFVLLALGTWRAAEVFTQPAVSDAPISLEQQKLLNVIEPLAGAGNVRINVHRTDAGARDFLVMIDTAGTPARGLGSDIEAVLTKAAGFSAAAGDTLTVQEFPFAEGASARPQPSELGQLGIMALLVFLLSWGAFAPAPSSAAPALVARKKDRKPTTTSTRRPRPVAVDISSPQASRAATAAQTASENPAETAKVIRAWMRAPES